MFIKPHDKISTYMITCFQHAIHQKARQSMSTSSGLIPLFYCTAFQYSVNVNIIDASYYKVMTVTIPNTKDSYREILIKITSMNSKLFYCLYWNKYLDMAFNKTSDIKLPLDVPCMSCDRDLRIINISEIYRYKAKYKAKRSPCKPIWKMFIR